MTPFPEDVMGASLGIHVPSCFCCAFGCPLYCSLPDILADGIGGSSLVLFININASLK